MAQITIHLSDEAEAKVRASAQEENISISRWIARLIEDKTANKWPASIRELAGAWSDFPSLEEIRESIGEDIPRETF